MVNLASRSAYSRGSFSAHWQIVPTGDPTICTTSAGPPPRANSFSPVRRCLRCAPAHPIFFAIRRLVADGQAGWEAATGCDRMPWAKWYTGASASSVWQAWSCYRDRISALVASKKSSVPWASIRPSFNTTMWLARRSAVRRCETAGLATSSPVSRRSYSTGSVSTLGFPQRGRGRCLETRELVLGEAEEGAARR